MPSVEELMGDQAGQPEREPANLPVPDPEPAGPTLMDRLQEMITAPTGDGPVESYQQHALNFNRSLWMARILRGLTGMLGNLNLAVVDVAVGIFEMIGERRRTAAAAAGQADHATP